MAATIGTPAPHGKPGGSSQRSLDDSNNARYFPHRPVVSHPAPLLLHSTAHFPDMGTITKRDLVVQISDQTGLTQHQVFDVLQLFLDNITSHLAQNNEVVLRNFGTFEIRVAKAKIGRNPNNPEKDVPIPARAIVKFKPGKELKVKVATLLPELKQ